MLLEKRNKFYIVIAVILVLNGVLSFAWSLMHWEETLPWALLSANFMFFAGITQAGIIFSAIMRIAGAEWGRYYSSAGEIITLSTAPMVFILFLFIAYAGGADHLFFWLSKGATHAEIANEYNPLWFNKGSFIWRNIISMGIFYIISYWYYRKDRKENLKSTSIIASLVIISYIIHNTIMAWDFGMTIIPHWESNIFPPYFMVGNIFSGTAFLLILSQLFLKAATDKSPPENYLVPMGKLLFGYTLTWIYTLWSQYIVIWYGDIPRFTEPLYRQMNGNYRFGFSLMIIMAFPLPFMALVQRRIKSSRRALIAVSLSICTGIWINKYLMVLPYFSDGASPVAFTWTGLSLIGGGLGIIFLSVILFQKLFAEALEENP